MTHSSLPFNYTDYATIAVIVGLCFLARWKRGTARRERRNSTSEIIWTLVLIFLFAVDDVVGRVNLTLINRFVLIAIVVVLLVDPIRWYLQRHQSIPKPPLSQP